MRSDFYVGVCFFLVGATAIAFYGLAARKLFGSSLDFVQLLAYHANTDSLPLKLKLLEAALRVIKFFGVVMLVLGPFIAFH
jgi:hypothetical protein